MQTVETYTTTSSTQKQTEVTLALMHSDGRLWVVLRAIKPGRWKIPFHTIYYTMNGVQNSQVIPISDHGSVSKGATYLPRTIKWQGALDRRQVRSSCPGTMRVRSAIKTRTTIRKPC
jgi:hypothetical protein